MNSTIDSPPAPGLSLSASTNHPQTIVLQPYGDLTESESHHFRQTLEEALELAADNVIVDLLWVQHIDSQGIAALVSGIEKAMRLSKSISFKGMNHHTRFDMESEWERQRQIQFGTWIDSFKEDLEAFLVNPLQ